MKEQWQGKKANERRKECNAYEKEDGNNSSKKKSIERKGRNYVKKDIRNRKKIWRAKEYGKKRIGFDSYGNYK